MTFEERLLKVLISPHISEKSSTSMEKCNTVVLKVSKKSTKHEIKCAVQKLFNIEVDTVRTVYVKGKKKRQSNRIISRKDWKKAYIKVKKDQNLDFMGNIE